MIYFSFGFLSKRMSEVFNIIHSHDGAADDQMALLLLLTKHKLLATVLTPADSRLTPAKEMCQKILALTDSIEIPLIVNDTNVPNPFPEKWRDESNEVNELIDHNIAGIDFKIGDIKLLTDIILGSDKDIIYIETGPLTTLAQCLKLNPLVEKKISKIIWTGGSFGPNGTYLPEGCDGSQTYNSYCDPYSAKVVFDTNIEIILLTREVTELALLSRDLYDNLPETKYGDLYRRVYGYYIDMSFYRLWDVLTVSYIDIPEAFKQEYLKCKLVTEGTSSGRTLKDDYGREVCAVYDVNLNLFYDYVIKQMKVL